MALEARDIDLLRGLMGAGTPPLVGGQQAFTNLPRWSLSTGSLAIAASGVMMITEIILPANFLVTNLSVVGGATAEATGTHAWMALYSGDRNLIGQTADDTGAAAIAATTMYTRALQTPTMTVYGGLYYFGISVTATTMPTLIGGPGQAVSAGAQGLLPVHTGTTGSALLGVAPNPMGAVTATQHNPFVMVS